MKIVQFSGELFPFFSVSDVGTWLLCHSPYGGQVEKSGKYGKGVIAGTLLVGAEVGLVQSEN